MNKKLKYCFLLTLVSLMAVKAVAAEPDQPASTRVACMGASITAGAFLPNAKVDSFPSQLQRMLGEKWEVHNFGVNGTTLLNEGDSPYQKQEAFQKALKLNPDVIIIDLGGNDSKPQNWKFKDQFIADYKDLIEKCKALPAKPRILLCQPAPAPGAGNYGSNEPGIEEIIPMIEAVAQEEKVEVIDMHGALAGKDKLFPDRVHPNVAGAEIMARTAYKALTGNDFEGPVPKNK